MGDSSGDGASPPPPCRLLARTKTNVLLFTVSSDRNLVGDGAPPPPRLLWQGGTSWASCSPDGNAAYLLSTSQGLVKCDLATFESQVLEDTKSVQVVHLSPTGSHAVTWERASDANPLNLKAFRDNNLVASFPQKSFRRDAWPSLQFTHDERFAFLLATNEVRIYAVDQLGPPPKEPRYIAKLHLPKLASFSLPARASSSSGRGTYFFTAFCSGTKDQPAKVSLHEYRPTTNDVRAVMGKSLFQAEEMKSHWSPTGDAALVTLQTSVDASGESYYGSSQLFLLSASVGATTAEVVAVPVQAPVLDVAWMPHPSKPPCFAVVSGKMPALTTLHHGQTAQQTFIFGNDHRNTIAWAPHGRFVMLAGFGNLAGGMGFWDRNKMKLIPHSPANANNQLRAANSTAYGWSPDSRLFVTATCSPRLNVDNGIRLWRYTGEEVKTVPWDNATFQPDKLLQAQFVPSLLEVYPDRPQSPTTLRATGGDGPTDVSGPNTVAPAPPPPKATTAYVPPSARNRAAGSAGRGPSLAERLRREKEEGLQQARRVVVPPVVTAAAGATAPGGRVIPGLAPAVKSKNAIKREKTKLKKQQQEETAGLASDAPVSPEPAQGQGAPPPPEENALDPEKRIRKLKKALKQIEEIKQRAETDLNDDQKSKLANEAKIRADLQELGAPP